MLKLNTLNANSLNNTKFATMEVLFFNRVEKVGSQSLSALIETLAKINNFSAYRNIHRPHTPLLYTEEQQRELAEEIIEINETMSYVEHKNWIDFTQFNLSKPIYINLVRHPFKRILSSYYYRRHPAIYAFYVKFNGRKLEQKSYFDTSFNDCVRQKLTECVFEPHIQFNGDWRRSMLNFCGNLPICKVFNSEQTAQIAKSNVEKEYAVVGSWEDTNITLAVLEHYIPRYFRGAAKEYYKNYQKYNMNSTPYNKHLDEDILELLKRKFYHEIDFYNFCKQRLYRQYIAINKKEMEHIFD